MKQNFSKPSLWMVVWMTYLFFSQTWLKPFSISVYTLCQRNCDTVFCPSLYPKNERHGKCCFFWVILLDCFVLILLGVFLFLLIRLFLSFITNLLNGMYILPMTRSKNISASYMMMTFLHHHDWWNTKTILALLNLKINFYL